MTQTMREQLQALVDEYKSSARMADDLYESFMHELIASKLESILATPDPAVTVHGIQNEWMRAIGKAASALRFTANEWEWYTEAAKAELLKISEQLTELETHLINYRVPAVTVRKGWVVKDRLGIAWSRMKPRWDDDTSVWLMPGRSIFLNQSITDPWPDHPNGGPECCMEVK